MALQLRRLTDEEQTKLERLTRAQSAPLRLVRRAQIIWLAAHGLRVPAIARQLGIGEKAVRQRLARFETAGLDGLEDAPRSGRPRTYTEDVYSQVVAKARALPPKPVEGDAEVPPTCHWTLDRLHAELAKEGLSIQRSQIRRVLKAEHITWQKPRTWLESTDPDFAEKRGPSSGSTRRRQRAAR